MNTVAIIGMGLSVQDLTESRLSMIMDADILVGGNRHLEAFPEFKGETYLITRDLPALGEYIRLHMERSRIVVLASGDPLYYGIGEFLINTLGKENISICPNVSSVAGAFARIKIPWQDAFVSSLHGRNQMAELLEAVIRHDKVALFTDPDHTPARIALFLIENGVSGVDMWVAEQMGSASEQVRCFNLKKAAQEVFSDLNMVVLIRQQKAIENRPEKRLCLGIPDTWLAHEKGMITKPEIRVIALSKLQLKTDHVFWDLGAGSGSISLEAALFIKAGRIISVEKNQKRLAQMEKNRERFGIANMAIVSADMPDGLRELPAPDRVFIGGGGKKLKSIIETTAARLREGGIVVINAVLLSSFETALNTLRLLHFETEYVQVQVNVGKKLEHDSRLEALNPVWVVSGHRVVKGQVDETS